MSLSVNRCLKRVLESSRMFQIRGVCLHGWAGSWILPGLGRACSGGRFSTAPASTRWCFMPWWQSSARVIGSSGSV
jgi:hypothetical protein